MYLFLCRSIKLLEPYKHFSFSDILLRAFFYTVTAGFQQLLSYVTRNSKESSSSLSHGPQVPGAPISVQVSWKETLKLLEIYRQKPNTGLNTKKAMLWKLIEGIDFLSTCYFFCIFLHWRYGDITHFYTQITNIQSRFKDRS